MRPQKYTIFSARKSRGGSLVYCNTKSCYRMAFFLSCPALITPSGYAARYLFFLTPLFWGHWWSVGRGRRVSLFVSRPRTLIPRFSIRCCCVEVCVICWGNLRIVTTFHNFFTAFSSIQRFFFASFLRCRPSLLGGCAVSVGTDVACFVVSRVAARC